MNEHVHTETVTHPNCTWQRLLCWGPSQTRPTPYHILQ